MKSDAPDTVRDAPDTVRGELVEPPFDRLRANGRNSILETKGAG